MVFDGPGMHVVDVRPKLLVGLGIAKLQGALLVERDQGDAGVNVAEELALCLGIDAVRELGKALMQPLPEGDAGLDRWRHLDRAEAGDVLVTNPTVAAAGLNEAHL